MGEQAVPNVDPFEQAKGYVAYFPTYSTRLFRRDPRIRFVHCVHESVVDSMESAGLRRGHANFVIHHFGYVDGEVQGKKGDLYYRLAYKKLTAAPDSFQANLEAGMAELDHAKQAGAALQHFMRATSIDPLVSAGWLYRGICSTRLGRYAEALKDFERAAHLRVSHPLLHSATGDVYFQMGRYDEARAAFVKAREFGDVSALTWAKLGAAEVQLGFGLEGLLKVQHAVAEKPDSGELLDILATTALLAGEPAAACGAADRRLMIGSATGFHFLLAATIHRHAGDVMRAEAVLQQGLAMFPNDAQLQGMMAAGLIAER